MARRPRLSAATRPGWDHGPRRAASVADVAAFDSGQPVIVGGAIKRLYGDHPGRWRGNVIELTPEGLVISRRLFYFITIMRRTRLPERILAATVRPFKSRAEAMGFASTGIYGPGGPMESAGSLILSCQTDLGAMEIAIGRRDLPLFLHYIKAQRARQVPSPETG